MKATELVFLVLGTLSTTQATPISRSKADLKVEDTSSRIVGGELSTPGDYPYFVEMGGCGGALIGPDTVLFAAHCGNWTDRQISIGAYTTRSLAEGAQERFCDVWIPDPLYGSGESPINYDFALCKLNKPVTIDTSFVSLELNEAQSVPLLGDDLIIMGLGTLSSGGSVPESVHNVTVPYVSNSRCTQSDYYGERVTDNMLCAGFDAGGKDSCQGDSGGPIVKRTYQGDGRFVDTHVGVVSWGEGCALPKRPGVYARTSKRASWIKSTVCDEFNSVASFCSNPSSPDYPCDQDLRIRIKMDGYPLEVTTTLRQDNGQVVLNRLYLIRDYENEHKVCLEENACYTFSINDSFGDGITNGRYELILNGQIIKAGSGDFGSSTTESFCTGNSGPNPSPVPQPAPTVPPQQPSPNTGDCGGNPERQFQLELRTDFFGYETSWGLYEVSDEGVAEEPAFFGANYEGNTIYTLPAEDNFFCLKLGHCYIFEIYDYFGDGMEDPTAGYIGFLDGEDIFSGDGVFDNDGFMDWHNFCVEESDTSPPTDWETEPPSSQPTAEVTTEETSTFTNPADSDPTPSPTPSPTPAPTPSPTPSPTNSPTASPTSSTTSAYTSSSTECTDSTEFFFKNKKKKTCAKFLKGKKKKKIKKKCRKKWKGRKVMDWCPETCGRKVGLGRCDYLLLSNNNY